MAGIVGAALLLTSVPMQAQTPPAGAPPSSPLPDDASLEAWRTYFRSAIRAETEVLRELYKVESEEFAVQQRVANLTARLEDVQARRQALLDEIANLQTDIDAAYLRMRTRLRYVYKMVNRANVVRMLFRSQSIPAFIRRWRAVKRVIEQDRRRFVAHQASMTELRLAKADLAGEERELAGLLAQAKQESAALRYQQERRRMSLEMVLEKIKKDRAFAERTAAQLDQYREDASSQIHDLTTENDAPPVLPPTGQLDFAGQKGYLNPPVMAPIVRVFGPQRHERLGTVTKSNGVDFLAPRGTAVRSVAAGTVRFVGDFRGFGRVVIVDHGDRYHSLYGHLDQIAVAQGQAVAGRQVIGSVGSTGSLSGPRLHFEIRYQGKAVDPLPWLSTVP
ncbi:MAG: peptidoglycan DD-metalloendopeptidase family protein [Deltaproteobacteria bacterium]|nr:peptidoglycan DD-metalloendopeptidase family protein [bacterium]MCB9477965.1 peptidoglycan DD-metalloendopeptidase family protein [Deltaproteobacteria bacterium]MCB9488206.1 peptidoglycan DD-metalloendopeptidase family protein [Deltaproteobacteria bacterium]